MPLTQDDIKTFLRQKKGMSEEDITLFLSEFGEIMPQPGDDLLGASPSTPVSGVDTKNLIKVEGIQENLFGKPTEIPGYNKIEKPLYEKPVITFDIPFDKKIKGSYPSIPKDMQDLTTKFERPALEYMEAFPSEDPRDRLPKPPPQPKKLDIREDIDKTLAFLRGGPQGVRKYLSEKQAELALREQPLDDDERNLLTGLTTKLDELDPRREVGPAQFITDNFNQGALGSYAIEPRALPADTPEGMRKMYEIIGGVAHLSGFGVRLSLLRKYLNTPEISDKILAGMAERLDNAGARKSFELLVKHRDMAKDLLASGALFGASDVIFKPTQEDTNIDKLIDTSRTFSKGFATGVAMTGAQKAIEVPIEKLIKSDSARAYLSSATFGGLLGATKPVKADIEDDPVEYFKEKLLNMGEGSAAFTINHAIWTAFPALGNRYFKLKNKLGEGKTPGKSDIEEAKSINDDLETLVLRGKINQDIKDAEGKDLPGYRSEPPIVSGAKLTDSDLNKEKQFISPTPLDAKMPSAEEMARSSAKTDIPVAETPERLSDLLAMDPTKHHDGIIGWKNEVRAHGDKGNFKGVTKPVNVLTGAVAPSDIRAMKEGTWPWMVKPLFRGADLASIDTNEMAQNIDRLEEIYHTAKGAMTAKQKELANQSAMRKLKDPEYKPEDEPDPVIREIMVGFRRMFKNMYNEEKKLGYEYDERQGYVPELAKTREGLNEIHENRIRFATARDVVSGKIFLPSSLEKTGRVGSIEDIFLQAKHRARAFSQVKNMSKPALEYSIKLDAISDYLPRETQSELRGVYDLLVSHHRPDLDRLTDNTINGILGYIDKVKPGRSLVDRYGGEGVSRRFTGWSGGQKGKSFFSWNPHFYIRDRAQVLQVASLAGPTNMMNSYFKPMDPELVRILETDPEIAPFYQRVKSGEVFLDIPGGGKKGFWNKGIHVAVGKSHMSNVDGSLKALWEQSQRKIAEGKWTPDEGMQNLYWGVRKSQYGYDPARVPKLYRTALGREAFRFKSWGINKIFYIQEHIHRVRTGYTGFGAPLDQGERLNSALQLAWEAGIPSIKQGTKTFSALEILDQMRANRAIPKNLGDMVSDSVSTGSDLLTLLFDDDERKKKAAKKRLLVNTAMSYVPGGHSIILKFSRLPQRGVAKTFLVPPTQDDYKEWSKAAKQKKNLFGGTDESESLEEPGF